MGNSARILITLLLSLILWGCGGTGGKGKSPGGAPSVKVEEGTDLAELAKAVKTREDSLVLDLLLGYRMLLLGHPDPKSLDQETLKRARKAYERLEQDLRHGGLRPQEGGERVYSITNEDKLSLQEVLRSASASAGKSARAGDWERARALARDPRQQGRGGLDHGGGILGVGPGRRPRIQPARAHQEEAQGRG
jgi:hypothetical protein